jgi:glycosyltransferase involved in cell wall biosynthesis
LDQPGVTFHGRVGQRELYKEWLKSGIYIYETNFFETSNIASQEAQAMGAVPVFSPIFAQKENIKHGIAVEGNANDPLTHARFAAELVKLATQPELQELIRKPMMAWARKRFDWENFVTQWELEAEGKREEFEKLYDFPVQLPKE